MTRSFLQAFGLNKDAIDQILDACGAQINALKKQLTKLSERNRALQAGLDAANARLAGYEAMDLGGLQQELMRERALRKLEQRRRILARNLMVAGCMDADYILLAMGEAQPSEDWLLDDPEAFTRAARRKYGAYFVPEPQGRPLKTAGDEPGPR